MINFNLALTQRLVFASRQHIYRLRQLTILFCLLFTNPTLAQKEYVDEVLKIVEQHALHRDSLDFNKIRKDAYAMLGDAKSPAESYPTIKFILSELKDHHSFLMEKKEVEEWESAKKVDALMPSPFKGERMINDIGYIQLQGYASGDSVSMTEFVNKLQKLIKSIDKEDIRGWILDLRLNNGGNCWPMLAGIGPLLGDGTAGYFIDNNQKKTSWYYRKGESGENSRVRVKVSNEPYKIVNQNAPIAILTGGVTASSGEVVVTSFRGKKNSRSFGENTQGLSTANSDYTLSDGSKIFLTTGIYADRLGNTYGGKIVPDIIVPFDYAKLNIDEDPVVKRAIAWIQTGK